MSIYLGIDIGTISIKGALLSDNNSQDILNEAAQSHQLFFQPKNREELKTSLNDNLLVTNYRRLKGSPLSATYQLLNQIFDVIPKDQISGIRVCGSGGRFIADTLDVNYENEFRAIARGVGELYPEIPTVFEMGGENSKYIYIERDSESSSSGIGDYEKSGDCAAGTGSFLDQQASRLKFNIADIGKIVEGAGKSAKIAGRCSVFAKSDMIHAQQKGFSPPEVLKGLCEAVARNFKSSIIKGKRIKKPVLFIGGVAVNAGVRNAIGDIFKLKKDELFVPEYYAWMPAIGTAFAERDSETKSMLPDLITSSENKKQISENFPVGESLSMDNVVLLRDKVRPREIKKDEKPIDVYLGVDVGSVSTNLVVIDIQGNMVKEIYTRTDGRPIDVVDKCLKKIETEVGKKIIIKGVGATGSGRELIGELVGADTINDEITAHKTGAEFIAGNMLDHKPDTIFEIGGQDSKYISIENNVVVDFAMNEACAAGTGSFLEERAEELNISIKGEFAKLAFSSKSPIKLGERCTVFMQQDVAAYQQRGALKEDLIAGLAYSIVYNYLNRVVAGRKIGDTIFFQGGTAYNDAIAAAFSRVLNKKIIIPPYNGVIGALGAALLAIEKTAAITGPSKFRGFSLEKVDYTLREFTCKACSNYCNMQEFKVEGEKTYWGDQCSDKFRRRQVCEKKPVIDDLLALRRELLYDGYEPEIPGKATIGLPRGMYIYEQFPFWNTFFRMLGYRVLLSDETNAEIVRKGIENSTAEPCFPIQAYNGHVQNLVDNKADWIFIPNIINAETPFNNLNSYMCPWGQTIPFVVLNSPAFEPVKEKIFYPTLRFRDGKESILNVLQKTLKPLGEKKNSIRTALDAAYKNLDGFNRVLVSTGADALKTLEKTEEIGIILVGRTYNINDRGMTLDIGSKLRDYYGVNVIPMDFLPVDTIDISDVNSNMYWNYGRKIIAAAKIVGQYPKLHLIYLTNFKCGPDSYIKHYITKASGKPFLTLQFDGHSNDAGYITRCEAYLDSKGALRWWSKEKTKSNKTITTQEVILV